MISVIICSISTEKFKTVTALYNTLLAGEEFEIIGIHDARSLCEGYTRGMQQSSGELLVFCHDDIEILQPDFATQLKNHLDQYDVVGVAGTRRLTHPIWTSAGWPYLAGQVAHTGQQQFQGGWVVSVYQAGHEIIGGMQALDGLFIAARREVAEQLGWDSATFNKFHFYDIDFSFRAYLQGYKLAVANTYNIIHHTDGLSNPAEYQKFYRLFANKHQKNLTPANPRMIHETKVFAHNKEEVVEIMQSGVTTD